MHSNSTEVVKQNGYGHEAVKQSGQTLHYAAAELSMDRETILEAVKKDWDASQSAAEWTCPSLSYSNKHTIFFDYRAHFEGEEESKFYFPAPNEIDWE